MTIEQLVVTTYALFIIGSAFQDRISESSEKALIFVFVAFLSGTAVLAGFRLAGVDVL